ncbi:MULTISPECIES: hypothetical protein [Vibrio]|uniref:hypothetical protein n=1 Tax=Vibrio TaxID=662 RepID=UPI000A39F2A4|nr:hypothetical protein [Vibrio coralliirubri]
MAFFDISEPIASKVNAVANWVTIIGAALVLVGTIMVVWSGGIKEQYSNEKIQQNKTIAEVAGADAAKANAEAEKAKEHAAFLSRKAEEAKLEQERLKAQLAWRRLSEEQSKILHTHLSNNLKANVWVSFVKNDPESTLYREEINSVLVSSGVKTKYFSGYEMAVGLNIIGPPSEDKALLIKAFKDAGLQFEVKQTNGFSDGQLQVLVGSKPPVF